MCPNDFLSTPLRAEHVCTPVCVWCVCACTTTVLTSYPSRPLRAPNMLTWGVDLEFSSCQLQLNSVRGRCGDAFTETRFQCKSARSKVKDIRWFYWFGQVVQNTRTMSNRALILLLPLWSLFKAPSSWMLGMRWDVLSAKIFCRSLWQITAVSRHAGTKRALMYDSICHLVVLVAPGKIPGLPCIDIYVPRYAVWPETLRLGGGELFTGLKRGILCVENLLWFQFSDFRQIHLSWPFFLFFLRH